MDCSPVTIQKNSTKRGGYATVSGKGYPFEGLGEPTVSGQARAIGGDSLPIPSRGYPFLGRPGSGSRSSLEPWVGLGVDCRGVVGLLNLTTRRKSAAACEVGYCGV